VVNIIGLFTIFMEGEIVLVGGHKSSDADVFYSDTSGDNRRCGRFR